MLPAVLAGPRGVPWVGRRATPILAVDHYSRPPPRSSSPCAHVRCRQTKCDDLGLVCEAYAHSSSDNGGSCALSGRKMSMSLPGLDGIWRYDEGSAIGGNTRITKGNSHSGYTCHVKDLAPGQHRTPGAARVWRTNACRGPSVVVSSADQA